MAIEERDLVFPADHPKRDISHLYYSIQRIKNMLFVDGIDNAKYEDIWLSLQNTFLLMEREEYTKALGIHLKEQALIIT